MMRSALVALAFSVLACSIETEQGEVGVYQAPTGSGPGPPARYFLTMSVRDFKSYDPDDPSTNPAFNTATNSEENVVEDQLGADGAPVYKAPDSGVPTYGPEFFNQWYHDTPGTNITLAFPLPLALTPEGGYEYDSQKSGVPDTYLGMDRLLFLPIDDGSLYATAFGNQNDRHNFGFTGEVQATFTLAAPGAVVQVRSDDDLYLFIDGQLAIDLGGKHVSLGAEIDLDTLGVSLGDEHRIDLFYADRGGATTDLMLTTNFALSSRLE